MEYGEVTKDINKINISILSERYGTWPFYNVRAKLILNDVGPSTVYLEQ